MSMPGYLRCVTIASMVCGILGQGSLFAYEQGYPSNNMNDNMNNNNINKMGDSINNNMNNLNNINMIVQPTAVPNCPLEEHPDTVTMFIMRGPLGDPEPRTCPPKTIFMRSLCSCVNMPLEKCNLRPSPMGAGFYEENVFGIWINRPCGPGSAYSAATCDCSVSM